MGKMRKREVLWGPWNNYLINSDFYAGSIQSAMFSACYNLNLNLNSLLVKRQIDNPSPGAVTGGN